MKHVLTGVAVAALIAFAMPGSVQALCPTITAIGTTVVMEGTDVTPGDPRTRRTISSQTG